MRKFIPENLAETDFPDAILEVIGARNNFDFHPHEINRQIAPVNLRKTHGVLLSGQDELRLPLLAAVDGVQDLLLGEPVMIREALGVNQLAAELHQALLKTLRLRDAAQRRDFFPDQKIQSGTFAAENVLEIQRLVHALN